MWKPGDRLTHRLNPGLGPGRVTAVSGRSLTVLFPDSGETLTLAAGDSALVPLILAPGARARLETSGETVTVAALTGGAARLVRLDDGREVPAASRSEKSSCGGGRSRPAGVAPLPARGRWGALRRKGYRLSGG
jgi:hypothetical protein